MKGSILVLFLLFASCLKAQTEEEQIQSLEILIENAEQSGEVMEWTDPGILIEKQSIDLNDCNAFELGRLSFLTTAEIEAILEHKRIAGNYISPLELQTIDVLDFEKVKRILPWVKVDNSDFELKSIFNYVKASEKETSGRFSSSRPLTKGYTTHTEDSSLYYPGSPHQTQFRLKANYKKILFWGINAEKDAGEEFFSGSNRQGFDFYSAHAFIKSKGLIRKVALGDFKVAFGTGLTLGNGMGSGKSAMVLNVKRMGEGLSPYRSLNEANFLRGLGFTLSKNSWEYTLFGSLQKVDASLDDLKIEDKNLEVIRSLVSDGYHRSLNEQGKEKMVQRFFAGQHLSYQVKRLKIGGIYTFTRFDKPILKEDRVYNNKDYEGSYFHKTGLYMDLYLNNMNVFSEVSACSGNSLGGILGAFLSLRGNIDMVMVYRNYMPGFNSDQSNAFSESSGSNNEKGFYICFKLKYSKRLEISTYLDMYKLPWYSFLADGPKIGNDFLLELNYKINKHTIFYIRSRTKNSTQNEEAIKINSLQIIERSNMRFNLETAVNPSLTLRARCELSSYMDFKKVKQKGFMFYADLTYKTTVIPISISARMSWFNTDDYETRIYTLEKDVMYSYAVTGFSGTGHKFYLLATSSLNKKIKLQFRYSLIKYYDRTLIGSGWSEVSSDKIHQINLLISYRFR